MRTGARAPRMQRNDGSHPLPPCTAASPPVRLAIRLRPTVFDGASSRGDIQDAYRSLTFNRHVGFQTSGNNN